MENRISPHQKIDESMATIERGIDVSNWQGKIDWKKVKDSGINHVCMKMSEGKSFVDPEFVRNWTETKKYGFKTNCYHYFRAPNCTPLQQFENIKKNTAAVGFDPTKNTLVIDVEAQSNETATPLQMADNLNSLLKLIKEDSVLSRQSTMIYTSYGYWDTGVKWNKYNFSEYPLWVAHWKAQAPRLPQPWRDAGKTWTWWQYSAEGNVEGIGTAVDLDWVKV